MPIGLRDSHRFAIARWRGSSLWGIVTLLNLKNTFSGCGTWDVIIMHLLYEVHNFETLGTQDCNPDF